MAMAAAAEKAVGAYWYGDMFSVTKWGYVIGSLTAMPGLVMIGFSVPILINNFIMYYQHVHNKNLQNIEQTIYLTI
jgi:hypothetical protein